MVGFLPHGEPGTVLRQLRERLQDGDRVRAHDVLHRLLGRLSGPLAARSRLSGDLLGLLLQVLLIERHEVRLPGAGHDELLPDVVLLDGVRQAAHDADREQGGVHRVTDHVSRQHSRREEVAELVAAHELGSQHRAGPQQTSLEREVAHQLVAGLIVDRGEHVVDVRLKLPVLDLAVPHEGYDAVLHVGRRDPELRLIVDVVDLPGVHEILNLLVVQAGRLEEVADVLHDRAGLRGNAPPVAGDVAALAVGHLLVEVHHEVCRRHLGAVVRRQEFDAVDVLDEPFDGVHADLTGDEPVHRPCDPAGRRLRLASGRGAVFLLALEDVQRGVDVVLRHHAVVLLLRDGAALKEPLHDGVRPVGERLGGVLPRLRAELPVEFHVVLVLGLRGDELWIGRPVRQRVRPEQVVAEDVVHGLETRRVQEVSELAAVDGVREVELADDDLEAVREDLLPVPRQDRRPQGEVRLLRPRGHALENEVRVLRHVVLVDVHAGGLERLLHQVVVPSVAVHHLLVEHSGVVPPVALPRLDSRLGRVAVLVESVHDGAARRLRRAADLEHRHLPSRRLDLAGLVFGRRRRERLCDGLLHRADVLDERFQLGLVVAGEDRLDGGHDVADLGDGVGERGRVLLGERLPEGLVAGDFHHNVADDLLLVGLGAVSARLEDGLVAQPRSRVEVLHRGHGHVVPLGTVRVEHMVPKLVHGEGEQGVVLRRLEVQVDGPVLVEARDDGSLLPGCVEEHNIDSEPTGN